MTVQYEHTMGFTRKLMLWWPDPCRWFGRCASLGLYSVRCNMFFDVSDYCYVCRVVGGVMVALGSRLC